jgi:Effector Associated Constant Component 1
MINIRMTGDGADEELRSLQSWLQEDDDVRRYSLISLSMKPPKAGEMGGALEAIKVIADEGFQVANLALALSAWRVTRRKRPAITIEHDNEVVSIKEGDLRDAKEIADELEK